MVVTAHRADGRASCGEISRRTGIDRTCVGRIAHRQASTTADPAAGRALSTKQIRDSLLQSFSSRLIEATEVSD